MANFFSFLQYVIQIGMIPPRTACNINMSRDASVLLDYTHNNGVTWHLLKDHRAVVFSQPQRVAIMLDAQVSDVVMVQ